MNNSKHKQKYIQIADCILDLTDVSAITPLNGNYNVLGFPAKKMIVDMSNVETPENLKILKDNGFIKIVDTFIKKDAFVYALRENENSKSVTSIYISVKQASSVYNIWKVVVDYQNINDIVKLFKDLNDN